jgi:hypothetical protein
MKSLKQVIYYKGPTFRKSNLFLNDSLVCSTLEPKDRGLLKSMSVEEIFYKKVVNKTAIPIGKYQVQLIMSEEFGCIVPHIFGIPGFQFVEIHIGNSSADTKACILVGNDWLEVKDWIKNSRNMFIYLMKLLSNGVPEGIELEIVDGTINNSHICSLTNNSIL